MGGKSGVRLCQRWRCDHCCRLDPRREEACGCQGRGGLRLLQEGGTGAGTLYSSHGAFVRGGDSDAVGSWLLIEEAERPFS